MNITLNIASDITPDAFRALLQVASEFAHLAPQNAPGRAASVTVAEEYGPNVQAYMARMNEVRANRGEEPLKRFRRAAGMEKMDGETAALVMLAALNADTGAGATYAKTEGEALDYADGSDDMGDAADGDLY